jgi:hypothetical protein
LAISSTATSCNNQRIKSKSTNNTEDRLHHHHHNHNHLEIYSVSSLKPVSVMGVRLVGNKRPVVQGSLFQFLPNDFEQPRSSDFHKFSIPHFAAEAFS